MEDAEAAVADRGVDRLAGPERPVEASTEGDGVAVANRVLHAHHRRNTLPEERRGDTAPRRLLISTGSLAGAENRQTYSPPPELEGEIRRLDRDRPVIVARQNQATLGLDGARLFAHLALHLAVAGEVEHGRIAGQHLFELIAGARAKDVCVDAADIVEGLAEVEFFGRQIEGRESRRRRPRRATPPAGCRRRAWV